MSITVLHPAPEPHHPECAQSCSAGGRWIAGPCQHQCAKTPEFQEQCERDAEASRLRFRRSLGIGVPREVPPADGVREELQRVADLTGKPLGQLVSEIRELEHAFGVVGKEGGHADQA